MADRIFPSAEKDSLGSAKQINTIDWDAFAKSFRTAAEEEKEKDEVEEEPADEDNKKPVDDDSDDDSDEEPADDDNEEPADEDDNDDDEEEEPKESKMKDLEDHFKKNPDNLDKLKGGLKDYMKKKLHGDKDSKVVRAKDVVCEKCAGKGCKACWDKKMASSEGRVIVFNHPSEISAEALMSAKTAGDDVKVRAILAAREQRNRVIEAKLESLAQDEVAKTEKLAARRSYRANIIAEAEKAATRLASAEAVVTKKSEKEGFKSVTAMKNDEKIIVAQRLLDNGFPKEYVEATLGMNLKPSISAEEAQIREVMSSSLNDNTKRTAVAGLVKVAKLSNDQLERCIRFWVDELGYGDEQWVRDLFTSKY